MPFYRLFPVKPNIPVKAITIKLHCPKKQCQTALSTVSL